MRMALCTKPASWRQVLRRLQWKHLNGLHRDLTLTPLNIFGMNCTQSIFALTSVLDLTNALVANRQCNGQIPVATLKSSRGVVVLKAAKYIIRAQGQLI